MELVKPIIFGEKSHKKPCEIRKGGDEPWKPEERKASEANSGRAFTLCSGWNESLLSKSKCEGFRGKCTP